MIHAAVIGAGQIGSRHLQALKSVSVPIRIQVYDPSEQSLETAKERYESLSASGTGHVVEYTTTMERISPELEIAICATGSGVRRAVLEQLLAKVKVKYLILEKLLFQRKQDYEEAAELFRRSGTQVWVNCTMRAVPFYRDLIREIKPPFQYRVTGGQYGLVTNAIHYLDHMAYLAGSDRYRLDTSMLDPRLEESKRPGYKELNGTLTAVFENGSFGIVTCYSDHHAPIQIEIYSSGRRFIFRESEGKVWSSAEEGGWKWQESDAVVPYQSQLTTSMVERLLNTGDVPLVRYEESANIHLHLLEPLLEFINQHTDEQHDHYPFT